MIAVGSALAPDDDEKVDRIASSEPVISSESLHATESNAANPSESEDAKIFATSVFQTCICSIECSVAITTIKVCTVHGVHVICPVISRQNLYFQGACFCLKLAPTGKHE
jgi:hypothetical protein